MTGFKSSYAHLVLPIYFVPSLPSSKAISPEAVPTSSSGRMTWAHLPFLGTSSFRSKYFLHLVSGLEGGTPESYGIPEFQVSRCLWFLL